MKYECIRSAYGKKLVEAGAVNKNIVALEADLGKSTMSCMFEKAYPNRFFEMNIAEQNMAAFAGGLALTGKIPFIHSFAIFASGRCFEQIRQSIGTAKLSVKICGSSCGLSDFGDGATHQTIEDIAIMRTIPGMVVLEAVDANQVEGLVDAVVAHDGPVYFRMNRSDSPVLTQPGEKFEIGKIYTMREGSDAVIFACGNMVSIALEAADLLEKQGVSLKVLNVSTLKPLDHEYIKSFADGMKAVLTAEEHSVIGGLNSAVCQAIAGSFVGPVVAIGMNDCFGFSTLDYQTILNYFEFTPERIANDVVKSLGAK
ncbi:MAG: transketolase family protein [Clostridia bacterium]|jgi:transketolase|nr:transketolase family protein [Clostridia bacterium]